MKNIFVILMMFIMIALFTTSCGTVDETIKAVCNESQNICTIANDICNMYHIENACDITNQICYYANNICINVINVEDNTVAQKSVDELKLLTESLQSTQQKLSKQTGGGIVDVNSLVDVLNKLKNINQELTK